MKRILAAALLCGAPVLSWGANEFAFAPCGPTVLVDTTPRQVVCSSGLAGQSYRVRNLGNAQAYFTWAPPLASGAAQSGLSATAPVAGTVAPNVIGMLPQSVESFIFPASAWFQAGATFTFEVTPGEGR